MISSVRCILHRLPHSHEHGPGGQAGGAGVEVAKVPSVQHAGHHHGDVPARAMLQITSCANSTVQL